MAQDGMFKKGYRGFVKGENSLRHILLLIIRLYWGSLLVMTGLGKWMNIQGVTEYFSSLHIPYPQVAAYCAATVELLGGISLFLGFFSRIFSLLLSILFITAYSTAHKEAFTNLQSFPSQFIMQDPFLYLYAALIILCFGPGIFSIDYWLEKRSYGEAL